MSWSALASKKPAVSQAPAKLKIGGNKPLAKPASAALADGKIRHVILDAGAFVSRRAFYEALGPDVSYLTTRRVLDEIRDKESRRFVESFPYPLRVKTVSDEAKRVAAAFCKASRDLHNLSPADLEIIALGFMIEKENHAMDFVNLEPKTRGLQQAVLDKINKTAGRPPQKPKVVPLAKTRKVKPLNIEKYLSARKEPAWERESSPTAPIVKKETDQKPRNRTWKSRKKGKGDAEEEDTLWITPENIDLLTEDQLMAPDKDRPLDGTEETSKSSVAVLTTDYQIQNALYQMNIRLLSVNGKSITTVHQWALRCYSCFTMEKDTTRRFCKSCGYTTLQRVNIWLDNTGAIKYKICQRKRFVLKGTIHNVPNPKAGRAGRGVDRYINTEDEYNEALRKAKRIGRKQRRKEGCSNEFGSVRFNAMSQVRIGAGSKNPNKSKGRRKRKKH